MSCCEDSNEIMYGIFMNSDDRHVGNIKIGPINQKHRHAAVGLLIGNPDYWGKGIATRAIKLVTDILAPQLSLGSFMLAAILTTLDHIRHLLKQDGLSQEKSQIIG